MKVIEDAEALAVGADNLLQEVRAAAAASGGDGEAPSVPTYSSSTTSCEVDPDSGVVTLTIKLYPGNEAIPAEGGPAVEAVETNIEPKPQEEDGFAPAE